MGKTKKVKSNAETDKTKKSPSKARPLSEFKYWHVLDSVVFIILILTVSLMMIFTGIAESPEDSISDFDETNEYSEQIAQTLLTCTIPRINYTDSEGQETIYIGWTVEQLIIEDLKIRNGQKPYKAPADIESLRNGLEGAVGRLLDDMVGTSKTFSLQVTIIQGEDKLEHFQILGNDLRDEVGDLNPMSKSEITKGMDNMGIDYESGAWTQGIRKR